MLGRFINYVNEQHLFPSGRQVLLAVSGGRDSVTMTHLMHRAGIPFAIAHCNFHLRPGDCDRDELFVRRLAKALHVPFHSIDFDTTDFARYNGLGVEEAARILRYRWFATLCQGQGYPCVAVAHHRDDGVETFFLNLFRGTGIAGLQGIRPVTTVYDAPVVRPLLCFSRGEINNYVNEQGLEYVEDYTNQHNVARRNYIRNTLLPALRKVYPAIDTTMESNIRHLVEAGQIYDNYILLMRERLLLPMPRRVPTMPVPLLGIHLEDIPAPRSTILFELLRPYRIKEETVWKILGGKVATGALFPSPNHDIVHSRGWLLIGEKAEPVIPSLGEVEERFSNGKPGIFVDADKIARPFTLRLWRHGDRMSPLGFCHLRKLSDVLKDLKLSIIEKQYVWVLADAQGHIVWVVGLMPDNRFRVTSRTTRVLHIFLDA